MEDEAAFYNPRAQSYLDAYESNEPKKSAVSALLTHLKQGDLVLDCGCGPGHPVASALADTGMQVHGLDVSESMLTLARTRCPTGKFELRDVRGYDFPAGKYKAFVFIYSLVGMCCAEMHRVLYRAARALPENGLILLGQTPADERVLKGQEEKWDVTKSYAEDVREPYFGGMFQMLLVTHDALIASLEAMGLEIVYDRTDHFQPKNESCGLEAQQYVVARRPPGTEIRKAPLLAPWSE